MWIDAHAHLAGLDERQLQRALRNAADNAVDTILNTGTDLDTSEAAIAQAHSSPLLRAAVGVSPFDVLALPPDWLEKLRRMLHDPSVVAVGEIGLDASHPRYPALRAQTPVLEEQLQLALETGLPAVVHSRGAESTVLDICKSAGIARVVFHCFTGSATQMDRIVTAGYCVSFSGIVTFASAQVASLVPRVPLDQLLIETDSPYLSPAPFRGRPNEPGRVAVIAEAVAALRGIPPADLAHALRTTFQNVFPRSGTHAS